MDRDSILGSWARPAKSHELGLLHWRLSSYVKLYLVSKKSSFQGKHSSLASWCHTSLSAAASACPWPARKLARVHGQRPPSGAATLVETPRSGHVAVRINQCVPATSVFEMQKLASKLTFKIETNSTMVRNCTS